MRTKTDEGEWKELLDSEIWRLGKEDEVVPVLRLSYNDLSASLKLLFAYCSLFPKGKDYVFDKKELIWLWMAEGFLHESTTSESMEQLDIGKKKEALQNHRHVLFVCEDHMVHERFEPVKGAKNLRTFLAVSVGVVRSWDRFYLSNKVLNDLLQKLPLLRVLSLSHLGICGVPEVVGYMKHLRYLNLSNTEITRLPENVCNLYNLTKLPKNFSKLQNLQHFDVRGTTWRLENMPLGGWGIEFPNWVGDPSFLRFTKVSLDLDGCEECTSLPPLGKLPSLKELFISDMPKVKVVGLEFLGSGLPFPSLEILSFENVPMERFHVLKIFVLNIVTIWLQTSSLTDIEIDGIFELTDELWRGGTKYLGSITKLKLKGCDEIRYLRGSEAAVNLKDMDVWNCNSLEHCSCPNSIEWFRIGDCDSVTSVSFPRGGEQKLKSLEFHNCSKIVLHNLPNLKSFMGLNKLVIKGCPSMESFPDQELPNLTSLIHITISKCISMDDSFPRGLWPPNLCWLEIGGLKKPISEWGPQNFPKSLTALQICGGPYDDVGNFDQLLHLFPSYLNYLSIYGFEKVELMSMGLHHLTSLQHLCIEDCPKIIDLPEMLLPSLLKLEIYMDAQI
ncbi:hypothetical protein LXL04_013347 [Taraxacum kok-saghyz]